MHPQIKIIGETSDGSLKAVRLNDDGSLVSSGGGGGGGTSDASAANQLAQIERLIEVRDRLSSIVGQTDTLEALLNTLNSYVDGLEALQATTNSTQLAISGFVDALEGYTDGIETNQATEISRLEAIRDRLPTTTGVKTSALSLPVTLSSDGAFNTNFGATTDASATTDTGTFSFLQFIKRLLSVKLPTALVGDRFKTDSLVRSMLRKLRDDFPGAALNPAIWSVIQTGAGQSITVTSSELRIAAGTTINSETIIRSVETFTIPFRTNFIANLSNRIANQEFYLEIIDATGGHYASWMFDGLTSTTGKPIAANSSNSLSPSGFSIAATNTHQIFEIEATPDEIYFYTKAADTSASRGSSVVKNRQIPDPNLQYYVQIRAKNLATAPASTTTLNIDAIAIQDIEELTTEITGGRGGGALNQAIPVNILAPTTLTTNTNITGGTVTVTDTLVSFTEFAIPLGAGVTTNGTARDTGSSKNTIRGLVFTDVSGILIVEQSIDNTTYRQTHSFPITGNAIQTNLFEFKLTARYLRYKYTNGATAQTVMSTISTQFNIGA